MKANANGVAHKQLAANFEQWDLLAYRPSINGVGKFNPPPNLLQSAVLDSVGSFVFFLHGSGGATIQYSVASELRLPRTYGRRYGKLIVPPDSCQCTPFPESRSVYGNPEFGAFLFGLMIGTPILVKGKSNSVWAGSSWLAAQLRGFGQQAVAHGDEGAVATMLANLLDPDRGPPAPQPNVGAASLLIFSVGSIDNE